MPTILIADEERNHQRLYKKELEKEGYRVVLSPTSQETLSLVEACRPDLVILDVLLSGMSGVDLIGPLLARHPLVPIIINTGYSTDPDRGLRRYVDAYVIKSSDLRELKSAIHHVIAEKTARREQCA